MKAGASDLAAMVAFFDYGETDRQLLADLEPMLEKHADALVEAFYRHLLSYPETRHHLRDGAVVDRLLGEQRRYLLSLAGPQIDEDYIADRQRIGAVHERIGLEPSWYMGAYALYIGFLVPLICESSGGDLERAEKTVVALQKLLFFDAQVAMVEYQQKSEHQLEALNQQLANSGRRLALDLERTGAALRRTSERAQAAERLASIGTLVAGLAHEIGTPMGVIQGHAKLLEGVVEGDDAAWRLKTIREQIGRISRIMNSLLNMARPSRQKRIPVTLEPLLDNTLAFLGEKLSRNDIRVIREYEPCGSIPADPERLQQLLLNLFLNAADAMAQGGELRISLRPLEEEVEILVSDTGPGISLGDPDEVFDPFFTTKEAGEGNGLGLAVAHGIVAEHHGQIEVAETGQAGTTFRIRLPAPHG